MFAPASVHTYVYNYIHIHILIYILHLYAYTHKYNIIYINIYICITISICVYIYTRSKPRASPTEAHVGMPLAKARKTWCDVFGQPGHESLVLTCRQPARNYEVSQFPHADT